MSKYTIEDVGHIIPVTQTATTIAAIETYLNEGVIPQPDPCTDCEPAHIRKLISLIRVAERNGLWPPKSGEKVIAASNEDDPDAEYPWAEGGYVAGIISKEELDTMKEKRPEMFADGEDRSEETLAEAEDQN